MKKISGMSLTLLVFILMLVIAPVNKAKAQFSASISYQTFYNELDPYGQWVNDPDYGDIWIPEAAGRGFRPYYSRGHWVMTRYGNMWVSDYPWGWATFHYGRWTYNRYYGWVWIPDTVWGPAWVSWRSGRDYYGWSPLGPGISINISFGRSYSAPADWWVFVPQRYFLTPTFYNYAIPPQQNVTYINNATIINNTYVINNVTYAAGPRATDIQRATGKNVPVYNVTNVSRPGKTSVQGNAVATYSPQVTKSSNGKPRDLITRDQYVKKNAGRNTGAVTPSPQSERKQQAQQQNNNRPVERNKQINQPTQQTERKQVQQQNNNAAERRQQANQQQQQKQQQQVQREQQQKQQQQVQREQQQKQQQQVQREQQQKQQQQVQPQREQQQKQQQQVQPQREQQQQKQQQQAQPQQQQRQQQQQPQPQQQSNPSNNGKGKKGNG